MVELTVLLERLTLTSLVPPYTALARVPFGRRARPVSRIQRRSRASMAWDWVQ